MALAAAMPMSASALSSSASLRGSSEMASAACAASPASLAAPIRLTVTCGRGDRRTAKGKRTIGSYGNCRPRANKGASRLGLPVTPIPAGSVSKHKKLEDDTEYIHIDLDEVPVGAQ